MQPIEQERARRISDLLAFLREHPAKKSSAELADQFGLEREFVSRLLAGIKSRPQIRSRAKKEGALGLARVGQFVSKSFARWPLLFVALSAVVYALIMSVSAAFGSLEDASTVFLTVALIVGQGLIYFKIGSPWFAAKGAGILFAPLYLISALELISNPKGAPFGTVPLLIILFFAFSILAVMYAAAFALVGIWGALYRQKRNEARLTRQELLRRYFELSERLTHASAESAAPPNLLQRFMTSYRANPYLWALFVGIFMTLLQVGAGAYAGVDPYDAQPAPSHPAVFFMLVMPLLIVSLVAFLFMTYASGSPKRGALVAIIDSAAGDLGRTLISHGRPHGHPVTITVNGSSLHAAPWIEMGIGLAAFAGFGAALGAAAIFGERTAQEKRLQANDEAALASELLSIQMRLTEQPTRVYVMVVDVVGSTAMKAHADTLTAEYAFRLYQQWIARMAAIYRGAVQATAGDGAIVAFSTADEALNCALETQRDIDRFNREENKLASPFRLRIGLHAGDVAADLREVQFTRVIDVAAHIEKVAPVGGVALSEELVANSSAVPVRDNGEVVDGSKIYTVEAEAIENTAR